MNKNKAIGSEWDDNFDKTILTAEEIVESDLRAALINELIMARKELGISQKQLEVLSGVKR